MPDETAAGMRRRVEQLHALSGTDAALPDALQQLHILMYATTAREALHPRNQATAVASGALEAVVAALARQPQHPDVAGACARALTSMCLAQKAHVARACTAGALPLFVAALRANRSAAMHCLTALDILTREAAHAAAAVRAGAVTAVAHALQAAPSNPTLQCGGCCVLYNLSCAAAPVLASAVSAGALELVAAALNAHGQDLFVVNAALMLLSELTGHPDDQATAERAVAAGVAECTLRTSRWHAAHATVQAHAAAVLLHLAPVLPERLHADAAAGAMASARAMPSDAAVLSDWLLTLTALVMLGPASARAARAAAVRAAGAVDVVAAALRTHAAHGQCLARTCTLLKALLRYDDAAGLKAVVAGVPPLFAQAQLVLQLPERADCPAIAAALQAAERRHDAARCAACDRCCRCAAAREAGALCGLPRCGLRAREGGAKPLLRCAGCRHAAFCCEAHQRECWPAHRDACKAARAVQTAAA